MLVFRYQGVGLLLLRFVGFLAVDGDKVGVVPVLLLEVGAPVLHLLDRLLGLLAIEADVVGVVPVLLPEVSSPVLHLLVFCGSHGAAGVVLGRRLGVYWHHSLPVLTNTDRRRHFVSRHLRRRHRTSGKIEIFNSTSIIFLCLNKAGLFSVIIQRTNYIS